MLVHKRRPGQGVVFDGILGVTVEEIAPEVWLSLHSQALSTSPAICAQPARTSGAVRLCIRDPRTVDDTREVTRVTTGDGADAESMVVLVKRPGEVVELDGITIELDRFESGEHAGKPVLHVSAPGLRSAVDLAVLTRYSYAVDLATSADRAVRIYRTEVWAPAAAENEAAANWTPDETQSLERNVAG